MENPVSSPAHHNRSCSEAGKLIFFHRQKFVNDLAIHEFHMKRLPLQSTFLNVLKEKEREGGREKEMQESVS